MGISTTNSKHCVIFSYFSIVTEAGLLVLSSPLNFENTQKITFVGASSIVWHCLLVRFPYSVFTRSRLVSKSSLRSCKSNGITKINSIEREFCANICESTSTALATFGFAELNWRHLTSSESISNSDAISKIFSTFSSVKSMLPV